MLKSNAVRLKLQKKTVQPCVLAKTLFPAIEIRLRIQSFRSSIRITCWVMSPDKRFWIMDAAPATTAYWLPIMAHHVIGVDISPDLIELAETRMAEHGYAGKSDFRIGSAHGLPIDDDSVDVVFGMAILHHLDLDVASKEVFRILKKGGSAIFEEPVRNSATLRFIRKLIPYQSPDVSPYERPLTDAELIEFSKGSVSYESRAFSLPFLNLFELLRLPAPIIQAAVSLDYWLLRTIPSLKHFASIRVIQFTK